MVVAVTEVGFEVWEFSFHTDASAEDAFDYLLDFERHREWEPELFATPPLRGASQIGARYQMFEATLPPRRWLGVVVPRTPALVCVLTAVERPSHLAWQERYPDPEGRDDVHTCDFFIEAQDAGTTVRRRQRFLRPPGWLDRTLDTSWKADLQNALRDRPARGLRKKLMEVTFGKDMFDALAYGDSDALSPSPLEARKVNAVAVKMERLRVLLEAMS